MKTFYYTSLMLFLLWHVVFGQIKDKTTFKVSKPNSNTSSKSNNQKNNHKPKKILPHQQPDFQDDCTRYYYWYYVNYLDTIQHPVIKQLIEKNGQTLTYDCFLEPFRLWESKNRKNLYCYALVDDYFRVLADIPLFKANVNIYSKYPQVDMDMYVDYTCFDSAGMPISPDKIRSGNVISYNRLYLYYKIKVGQLRSFFDNPNDLASEFFTQPGHTAIIADIRMHDKINKIIIMVILNKPYDFYSLLIYDYKYHIIIDDVSFIHYYRDNKEEMNKKFLFKYYDKYDIWMFDPAPFMDCIMNEVSVVETMNIYNLFKWYDKMKIPYKQTKK